MLYITLDWNTIRENVFCSLFGLHSIISIGAMKQDFTTENMRRRRARAENSYVMRSFCRFDVFEQKNNTNSDPVLFIFFLRSL